VGDTPPRPPGGAPPFGGAQDRPLHPGSESPFDIPFSHMPQASAWGVHLPTCSPAGPLPFGGAQDVPFGGAQDVPLHPGSSRTALDLTQSWRGSTASGPMAR
jgi:hypothetical protein